MPVVKTFIVEDSPIILDNLIATLERLVLMAAAAGAGAMIFALVRMISGRRSDR